MGHIVEISKNSGHRGEWRDSYEDQKALHRYYSSLLADPAQFSLVPTDLGRELQIRMIETEWNRAEEAKINHVGLPSAKDFTEWYYEIKNAHKSRTDILFDYLRHEATLPGMAFFICLEEKVDSRFEDLIVMAQLGVLGHPKLVIGHNYWDEMGEGDYDKIHAVMFDKSVAHMKKALREANINFDAVEPVEALKNANMLLMYGLRRQYAPRLIGALGILELTAPDRFSAMVDGCRRLGVPEDVIAYQSAHVGIDEDHASEWLQDVLLPMVAKSDQLREEICKGILIRYQIAGDYYVAARREIDRMV